MERGYRRPLDLKLKAILAWGVIVMAEDDGKLAEKLWQKVMERMPPGGTRKDVRRILKDIILGDNDDTDEGQGDEWVH